jgi:hypothetical protein
MTVADRRRPLGLAGRVALVTFLLLGGYLAAADPLLLLFYGSYASVGLLLAIRQSRNSVSWLLLAIALSLALPTGTATPDRSALAAGTAAWPDFLGAWIGSWSGGALFVAFFAFMIVFPSGRLPAGRWRKPAVALIALGLLSVLLVALAPTISFNPDGGAAAIIVPNRFAVLPDLPLWEVVAEESQILAVVPLLVIGAASMLVRYRRASGTLRLQLRWLVAALAFLVVALIAGLSSPLVFGPGIGDLGWIPMIIAYPTVPVAIALAILRYRLYDIDRIISRTVAYAVLSGLLALTFGGLVLGIQGILGGFTEGDTLAVAASTLAVVALFQPLRRRIQRAVDRRFNRARIDAEATSARFAERLRDEVDLEAIRVELTQAATSALAPAVAGTWVRGAGSGAGSGGGGR